jgi:hypothetical protein
MREALRFIGWRSFNHTFSSDIMSYARAVQNVPGWKVNILGGHNIGHSKKESVCVCVCACVRAVCPIPNGFRDRAISLYCTLYRQATRHALTRVAVHWCWRGNFRECIILGKLRQLCHLNNKYRYQKQHVISLSLKNFGTVQWNNPISETVHNRTHVHV